LQKFTLSQPKKTQQDVDDVICVVDDDLIIALLDLRHIYSPRSPALKNPWISYQDRNRVSEHIGSSAKLEWDQDD
jgi:hypothetical protein